MNDLTTTNENVAFNALMDPVKFTQMVQLSNIMAESSMIPDVLRYEKGDSKNPLLPLEVRQSNCFLIVEQSMRWGLSPFAVAQATSIVHGKLMFEGKLVAAVLDANLKVKLHYEYGKWDQKKQETDLTEVGEGDNLAVRVYELTGINADGDMIFSRRFVDGHVGSWKTTGANSPWRPGNFRKMLAYRGTREWARFYEPGPMLGVMVDDEIDFDNMKNITPTEPASAPQTGSSVMDRVKAAQSKPVDGFDNSRVQSENGSGSKAGETASDQSKSSEKKTETSKQPDKANQGDLLGGADKYGSSEDPNKLTDADHKWLLNSARMMWGPVSPGADLNVLKTQRKVVAETYPFDGVAKRATDKLKSIIDRCYDVAEEKLDPADGLEIIAGIVGVEPQEITKQAETL